jgi:hypothetical protein
MQQHIKKILVGMGFSLFMIGCMEEPTPGTSGDDESPAVGEGASAKPGEASDAAGPTPQVAGPTFTTTNCGDDAWQSPATGTAHAGGSHRCILCRARPRTASPLYFLAPSAGDTAISHAFHANVPLYWSGRRQVYRTPHGRGGRQINRLTGTCQFYVVQPTAKARAAHTCRMRSWSSEPILRPMSRCWMVVTLSRLTAHTSFSPTSVPRTTSVGMPRTVEVMGATVTRASAPRMESRVKMTTGRCLSGAGKETSRISPPSHSSGHTDTRSQTSNSVAGWRS